MTLTSPAGKTAARGSTTVSVPAGQTQTATVSLKVTSPALWSTDHPQLYTAQTDLAVGGTAADTVTTPFGIRYVTFDPAAGFSLNGQSLKIQGVDLHATEGAVGSAVRFDAMARQMAADEEHGRERAAHRAQPARPGADRGVRAAGHRDDGRGVRLLAHREAALRLPPLLRPVGRLRHQGDGQRREELAGRRPVVDRQRDPGHRIVPWPGDREAAGRGHQVHRHHPAGGDGLGQVPQRARHRVAAGPDRGRAGWPGRQLQHGHVHGRAAREVPGQVLLLLRDGLGDLHPRGRTRTRSCSTRGRTTRPGSGPPPPTTTTSRPGR